MDSDRTTTLTNGQLALAIAIFAVAALLRMWWNDIPQYSPADEAVYSDTTRQLILGYCALAHDFTSFFRIGQMITSAMTAPYVTQYQAGPPHRPMFDFFITAPLVSLLATAAVAIVALDRTSSRRERALVLFLIVTLAVFGLLPSKNLRFTIVIDPVIRLLAAWLIATRGFTVRAMAAFAVANAAIELELFYRIFARGGVYDPVTQSLLEAVGSLPHADVTATGRMLFPWICAAIFGVTWLWPRIFARSR